MGIPTTTDGVRRKPNSVPKEFYMKKRSQRPVEIYCDGSSAITHKLKPGGYGIVFLFGDKKKEFKSRAYRDTTISRMEIKAIIHALEHLKPGYDIYVYSDSKMAIDVINRKLSNWIEYGTLDNRTNASLWRRFLKAKKSHLEGGSTLLFCWIRGHSGSKYNEMADVLAGKAARGKHKFKCVTNN